MHVPCFKKLQKPKKIENVAYTLFILTPYQNRTFTMKFASVITVIAFTAFQSEHAGFDEKSVL